MSRLGASRPVVTTLRLEPLPAGDIRRLVQSRLGVEALPEALARQVTEKAEGNALFAEEILSFLTERGVLRDRRRASWSSTRARWRRRCRRACRAC